MDITVVTPSIAPRRFQLMEARESVTAQTLQPLDHIVTMDTEHAGAPATRHRGLMMVETAWVAFLDDDDLFMPHHLEALSRHAEDTDADYVFSWFETLPHGGDPFPMTHFTEPWNPDDPRQTTVTTLVRTSLAKEVGFLGALSETGDGMHGGEDWAFTLGCNKLGKISHLVERTWYWRHWGYGVPGGNGNTSGRGDRW